MNRLLGVHPLVVVELWAIGLLGALGVPGLLRPTSDVPFVSIYSRDDRVVDWRSCADPDARHREVRTTRAGLVSSTAALTAVAERLHRVMQAPDSPSGARSVVAA